MCIILQGAVQRNKETMAFQRRITYLAYWLDATIHQGGIHLGRHHRQLVQLILVKQAVTMVSQWLKLIIMKYNLIGSIALNGYCMNLQGASPLRLSHLNCQEVVKSLQWHGLGRMYMNGINGFLIRCNIYFVHRKGCDEHLIMPIEQIVFTIELC